MLNTGPQEPPPGDQPRLIWFKKIRTWGAHRFVSWFIKAISGILARVVDQSSASAPNQLPVVSFRSISIHFYHFLSSILKIEQIAMFTACYHLEGGHLHNHLSCATKGLTTSNKCVPHIWKTDHIKTWKKRLRPRPHRRLPCLATERWKNQRHLRHVPHSFQRVKRGKETQNI